MKNSLNRNIDILNGGQDGSFSAWKNLSGMKSLIPLLLSGSNGRFQKSPMRAELLDDHILAIWQGSRRIAGCHHTGHHRSILL